MPDKVVLCQTMSDYIIVDGKRVNLEKCDARVVKADLKEKFKYILQHGGQKADVVNKGIEELYIEKRCNENRANRTSLSDPPVSPVTVNVGGSKVPAAGQ